MSKLKDKAAELRNIARELDSVASQPVNTERVMRRFAPEPCHIKVTEPLYMLGRADFDARRHIVRDCGERLGRFIADKLELAYAGVEHRRDMPPTFREIGDEAVYVATVIPFTENELRVYTEKVIRAAREGLITPDVFG